MTEVFADSFYFFAMLNQRDKDHARAVEWTRNFTGRVVTTEWILVELADGLASSTSRRIFAALRQRLLRESKHRVIPLSPSSLEEGIELYDNRQDKDWSLTDCISFAVMKNERITDALTGDHHFEQAGFVALLK